MPHPVEHPALKDAVDMVLAGKSLAQIARYWKDHYGITTAAGGPIYEASIFRALVSPRMIGYRMRQVPEHQRGVKLNLLDFIARDVSGEPVISQEPVCDRATWFRVRRLLEEARTSRSRRPWGSHEWLLTGLVHCRCGMRLSGHHGSRKKASGERVMTHKYVCRANLKRGPGNCSAGCTINAAKSEAFVLGWFFSQITDEAIARARARRRTSESDASIRDVLTQLDDARAERDALLTKQGMREYRGAMVTVLLTLIEDAQKRVDSLGRRLDAMELQEVPIEDGASLISSWKERTILEKRAYLRRVIHRIDVVPGAAPTEERLIITPVE